MFHSNIGMYFQRTIGFGNLFLKQGLPQLKIKFPLYIEFAGILLSIIPQVSLIYSVRSTAVVKSVTNCELFVLSRQSLKRAYFFYPEGIVCIIMLSEFHVRHII